MFYCVCLSFFSALPSQLMAAVLYVLRCVLGRGAFFRICVLLCAFMPCYLLLYVKSGTSNCVLVLTVRKMPAFEQVAMIGIVWGGSLHCLAIAIGGSSAICIALCVR